MVPPKLPYFSLTTPPVAIVDNASIASAAIDTQGFHYARFIFWLGATDITATVPKVQDCATSGGSYADVTGATAATAITATDDDSCWVIDVALQGGVERYLKAHCTIGDGAAGAYMVVLCELYNKDRSLNTAADINAVELVQV